MGQIAVIIPTTQGLSRVQQVRVDQQLRHAVMTVNFRTERASVTADYAEYVARDAGIISRLTQEHRYRVKISRDIVTGSSWKLGMLVAHLLQGADQLAQADAPMDSQAAPAELVGAAERVIWATGDVSDEYGVIPVAQVGLKLEQSQALFKWCAAQSIPVDVFLPSVLDSDPNLNEQTERSLDELRSRFPSLRIHRLEQAPKDSSAWLSPGHQADSHAPAKPRRWLLSALIVLGIAAVSGVTIAVSNSGPGETPPPDEEIVIATTDREAEQDALSEETPSEPNEREAETAPARDPGPGIVTSSTEIEIFTTFAFHIEGRCFAERDNVKTIARTVRPSNNLTLNLPAAASICGVDVSTAGIAIDQVSLRLEGGGANSDRDRDIPANDVQQIKNQVFQSPRFNRLIYKIAGTDDAAQIAIAFIDDAAESEAASQDR